MNAEISYTYDALNRLMTATYEDGPAFGYTYDAAGITLEREQTVSGLVSTTVYTYD
jgi:YD repeat-containing protein